jgi:hypothetical protein
LDIDRIVNELKSERDRINRVIALLQGKEAPVARAAAPRAAKTAAANPSNRLSPEGRKKISEMMKKRWAERRRLKKSTR